MLLLLFGSITSPILSGKKIPLKLHELILLNKLSVAAQMIRYVYICPICAIG
jgi:hypothetical protein